MRRIIISTMMIILVTILVVTGCVGKAPEPVPTEPAGQYYQPNPFWGLGFKPDGTRYQYVYLAPARLNVWWVVETELSRSMLERSGATYDYLDCGALDADLQISQFETVLLDPPDAALLWAADSEGLVPIVDRVVAEGVPVFCQDSKAMTDSISFYTCNDSFAMGVMQGDALQDLAEQTGQHLHVMELTCPLVNLTCRLYSDGLHEAVEASPDVDMLTTIDVQMDPDKTVAAIADVFLAHPEANAVVHIATAAPVIEGLRAIGQLYPVGDPNHVVVIGIDEDDVGIKAVREGNMDAIVLDSIDRITGIVSQAMLNNVVLGKSIPKEVFFAPNLCTTENVDIPPYGDIRWTDMVVQEVPWDQWPILDFTEWGMPMPTNEEYQRLLRQ